MIRHLLWAIALLCPSPHLLPPSLAEVWGCAYMTTSPKGMNLIKQMEGFRSKAYQDGSGIMTIGYGHALLPLERLDSITQAQAESLLRQDLEHAEQCVHTLIPYPLSENQFDALVSLIFNIGCPAFKQSHIYVKLKNKDFSGAVQYWRRWVHAGNGRRLLGLAYRRKQEISLFVS